VTPPNRLRNVSSVVKADMCTGCGTCSVFCPKEAITVKNSEDKGTYDAEIDLAKCVFCGVCTQICPRLELNIQLLNKEIFGHQPASLVFGNFLECYSGYSNFFNSKLTDYVSSGGMATQLLVFALENGIIDGALVTRFDKKKPLEPQGFLATTVDEIISAAGSKYCSCPTNLGLRELLHRKGKFAVIGLPCHIQAIRKAQQVFPELRERIVLTIGLFCAFTIVSQGIDVLLRKLKIERNNVARFSFRGHGWPGKMAVSDRDGKLQGIPLMAKKPGIPFVWLSYGSYLPLFCSYLFAPWSCLFCQDHFNQLSDISLGDAWLREFRKSPIGLSLVVVRSEKGRLLVQKAISANTITMKEISCEKVIESQADAVRFKTKHWRSRVSLAQKMGKATPPYIFTPEESSSVGSYAASALRLHLIRIRRRRFAAAFFAGLPLSCYNIYNGIFYVLEKLP